MRIDVTSAGLVLTSALRGEVRRRVLLAMSRFGPEVHGVTARLRESHNPLGGVDQRCRIRARLQSGLVVRAEAMNGRIEAAVGRSAARLALRVAAALERGNGRAPGHRLECDKARTSPPAPSSVPSRKSRQRASRTTSRERL